MNIPKECCHPHCEQCPYGDCQLDGVLAGEAMRQNRFDANLEPKEYLYLLFRSYNQTPEGRERTARYNHSEKGKQSRRRYEQSDKAKQRRYAYNHSPAGIAARRKYEEKRKASNRMRRMEADAVGE